MSDDPILAALTRLEVGQADTSAKLVRLETGQADTSAKMVRLEAGQDDTSAKLVRLEAGQDDTSAKLVRLEAGQDGWSDQMDRLETGQSKLRSDFLDELGATRAAIMEKVVNLQRSVDDIRNDIGVNMGSVDAARLANDNTRADVAQMREQMSVMWKQLKALQARVRDITGDP